MCTLHRLITMLKQQGYKVVDVLGAEDGAQVQLAHKGYKVFARTHSVLKQYLTYSNGAGYCTYAAQPCGVTLFKQNGYTCASVYLLNSTCSAFPVAPKHKLP